MNWIDPKDKLPEYNQHVLLYYKKAKKGNWTGQKGMFFTEGYLDKYIGSFGDGKTYERISWMDYTDRLINEVGSNSKNIIIAWSELPEPPNN